MTVGFYRGLASQTERGSVASNVGALKFARKRSEGYFRENNRENIVYPRGGGRFGNYVLNAIGFETTFFSKCFFI